MDFDKGGQTSSEQQRRTAAEIARNKVLAAYSSTVKNLKNLPPNAKNIIVKNPHNHTNNYQQVQPDWMHQNQNTYQERSAIYGSNSANYNTTPIQPASPVHETPTYSDNIQTNVSTSTPATLKDTAIDQTAINEEWKKYHSAWQDYYKNYYSEYYAKAAQSYLATEKMKTERIATGEVERTHKFRRLIPVGIVSLIILVGLFLQYNRLIFTPIMAYISPTSDNPSASIEAIDPTVTGEISPDPRLIIPKLNVDTPIIFGISTDEVEAAMNEGVAQFSIPGANALPGQIGNLAISGHSSGDIYNSNQYKFIFSGLERLAVGDLIYINYNSVRYTYQMTRSEVVEPTDVAALIYETNKPMLTLITCTPLGTSKYRLLITAEQISPSYNDDETSVPELPETPGNDSSSSSMPANEPSFFEGIWNWLTGK